MQKLKFEYLLLLLAMVLGGLFVYRSQSRPQPDRPNTSDRVSQEDIATKSATRATVTAISTEKNTTTVAPKAPAQPTVSPQTEQSPEFKKYRELLQNPKAGMERLHLIELLKKNESPETIGLFLLNEVMNSGPSKELSATENHERRSVVGVAYSMFLDQCRDFNDCYGYSAVAIARHQDPETRNDLYQQTTERYNQQWQQDLLEKEMKKYNLEVKKPAPK